MNEIEARDEPVKKRLVNKEERGELGIYSSMSVGTASRGTRSEHTIHLAPTLWLLALAWLLSGSASMGADRGGVLVYREQELVQKPLVPIFAMNAATKRVSGLIFEPLLEHKKVGLGVRCRLCEDYTIADRLVTFRLKQNVLWHDGVGLTAWDVAFTYDAVTAPGNGSPLAGLWSDLVERVTVEDKFTVSFLLRRPVLFPDFYFAELPILPRHRCSVFQPALAEDQRLGTVRRGRGSVPVFTAPNQAQRAGWDIPDGARLSLIKVLSDGWAEVKVIAQGPVGKKGWILQHRVLMKDDAELLTHPIGTGPYKLMRFLEGVVASLASFEGYHGRKPYIEEIRWERTLTLPILPQYFELIPQVRLEALDWIRKDMRDDGAKLLSYRSLRVSGFLYNCRSGPLAKKELRQALTFASDRALWLEKHYHGEGTVIPGPAPPDSFIYNVGISPLPWDLPKARMLKAAILGDAEIHLKLIISRSSPAENLDMAQAYKTALADLGARVDISLLDEPAFVKALGDGDFDIAFQEVAFRLTEDFRPLFASNGARNYGHYQNSELDRLFDQWSDAADLEKLRVVANRSQEILAEDCPWTFLFSLKNLAAVSRKIRNIRGENIDPEHFFAWAHEWWIPSESQ